MDFHEYLPVADMQLTMVTLIFDDSGTVRLTAPQGRELALALTVAADRAEAKLVRE